MQPASQNPYPIHEDQNLRFSQPYLWPAYVLLRKLPNSLLECKNHALFLTTAATVKAVPFES